MKVSLLMLSHNRPKLFERSIKSVLASDPIYDIEIIVNNDTRDITEVYSNDIPIMYYYEQHNDISKIYEMLYTVATGDYIYYLEDDDYLMRNFWDGLKLDSDVIFIEYLSIPLCVEMCRSDAIKTIKRPGSINHNNKLTNFLKHYNEKYFQLGQIIFKNNIINKFPVGNNIHNDYLLLQELAKHSKTFKYIKGLRWVQTQDGNDNISYKHLNMDARFK